MTSRASEVSGSVIEWHACYHPRARSREPPRMHATRKASTILPAVAVATMLAACAAREVEQRPIVVQGAMDVEIRRLAAALADAREERVGQFAFWIGTIDGYPVVISKTLKGMENAAAATALAAERYRPAAIVNQGTAGGHQPDVHVFDIILGVEAVNLGSFKTGFRARGGGSDVAEWSPLDLNR